MPRPAEVQRRPHLLDHCQEAQPADRHLDSAAPPHDARDAIRGRGLALGREGGGGRLACADAEPADRRPASAIRGHAEVLGAAARADADRWAKAQRRLDARNAHLATSLSDHAERVARRDAAGDRPREDTAKERLEALRRRVAAKRNEAAGPFGGGNEVGTQGAQQEATVRAGDAAPAAGCGHQRTLPVGTTEVLKIHFVHADVSEFGRTTAGDKSAENVPGSAGHFAVLAAGFDHLAGALVGEDARGASGALQLDNARMAAARDVAWHTAAR